MADHNDLGKLGEAYALQYLKEKGYEHLVSNWRFRKEEIDLIFKYDDQIIFVEVKTRTAQENADVRDLISQKKIGHLIDGADYFLSSKNLDMEARFDVMVLLVDGDTFEVDHIISAFSPTF